MERLASTDFQRFEPFDLPQSRRDRPQRAEVVVPDGLAVLGIRRVAGQADAADRFRIGGVGVLEPLLPPVFDLQHRAAPVRLTNADQKAAPIAPGQAVE